MQISGRRDFQAKGKITAIPRDGTVPAMIKKWWGHRNGWSSKSAGECSKKWVIERMQGQVTGLGRP